MLIVLFFGCWSAIVSYAQQYGKVPLVPPGQVETVNSLVQVENEDFYENNH